MKQRILKMKVIQSSLTLLAITCVILAMQSCAKDDVCEGVSCENGGIKTETLDGCACDCSGTLYTGAQCESFNIKKIQALLDSGVSPLELINGDIVLDSLYGKIYKSGLIFYMDTTNGTGFVAATEDQSTSAAWGCLDQDIMDLNNFYASDPLTTEGARIGDGMANTDAILNECLEDGIAAKLCRDLGPDWFLPSSSEILLMFNNLHKNGHGGFTESLYWASSEAFPSLGWYQGFVQGYPGGTHKDEKYYVRAARAF